MNHPGDQEVERAREWVRVQQEDANGCVVATLAMLTGDSYAQVKSAFVGHDFSKTGCCSEFEGCNYLRERGFAYQKMYRHNGLTKTDREDWPILWVKSRLLVGYMAQVELGGNVHAVAVKPNGTVLDPWRDGEYRLADYAKCNHLIAVFDIQACSRPADVEAAYSSSRDAEQKVLVAELVGALEEKARLVHNGTFHQWNPMEVCKESTCKKVMELLARAKETM